MLDHYRTLGVERTATQDEIKRAYRKLANLYHPDKEGGSNAKFQELQRAYQTLGDPNARAQYDSPQPNFGHQDGGQGFDFQSIFDMFGTRFGQQAPGHFRQQARMSLWVTLEDIARGGRRTVSVGSQHGTQAVELEIPQGIDDGDTVQYGGIGPQGGDLIVTYRIHPNPRYQRQGLHLIRDERITVWDLILGTTIIITDIMNNRLELVVPAGTQPGARLRLRARGLTRNGHGQGDLIVQLTAVIPTEIDPDLRAMIKQQHRPDSA